MSEVRPAGWYPDPQSATREKWFDGTGWTQATRQRSSRQYTGARAHSTGVRTPRGNRKRAFGALCAILMGLLIMTAGVGMYFSMRTPENMSATASGTVTDVKITQQEKSSSIPSRSGFPTCHMWADFVVDAKNYPVSASKVTPCPWSVGQQVTVAYDPASPASAMIPSEGADRYAPAIIVGMGALLVVGMLFVFVRAVAAVRAGPPRTRRHRRATSRAQGQERS